MGIRESYDIPGIEPGQLEQGKSLAQSHFLGGPLALEHQSSLAIVSGQRQACLRLPSFLVMVHIKCPDYVLDFLPQSWWSC